MYFLLFRISIVTVYVSTILFFVIWQACSPLYGLRQAKGSSDGRSGGGAGINNWLLVDREGGSDYRGSNDRGRLEEVVADMLDSGDGG